jgi:phosphatidylglycerophosphate synthase
MPELKTAARYGANILPLYRAYSGYKTAERLRSDMKQPWDRTWEFAGRVLLDAGTDKIDGILARYAGSTLLGGYMDQLADKAWFLQITRQLVKNGELKPRHLMVPAIRDAGNTILRPIAQHYGLSSDAKNSGKIKMAAQVAATVSACSPMAFEQPSLVRGLYELATTASVISGIDLLRDYTRDILSQYHGEPAAEFIVAASTRLIPLIEAI